MQFNMNNYNTHQALIQFIKDIKVIPLWDNYGGQYLPELEQIREQNYNSAQRIKDIYTEEYFAGNFELFEKSLKYIDVMLEEMTADGFSFCLIMDTPFIVTDEYVNSFVSNGIYHLKDIKQHIIKMKPAPPETEIQHQADVSEEPEFDDSIKISIKNDTRRIMFLYEFDIIDQLQRMGYTNNQIGVILMDLFELSENENKNRRINIGSLISKIQNKTPNNPYDSNAGRDFIATLEEKYEIKSRKKP
jgi:hypothetical protein